MKGSEFFQKAVCKFRREGFAGVWNAGMKRLCPLLSGLRRRSLPGGAYSVLYVVGCREGESRRYRIDNLAEALVPLGVCAEAATPEELAFRNIHGYVLVVFFRCEYNRLTEMLLKKCRAAGIPSVFDVDDLVFDESVVCEIDAFRQLDPEGQYLYLAGVRGYRAMLEACDNATASTDFLCRYMERMTGKGVFRIPNGVNRMQIRNASVIRRDSPDGRQIGYLSGSRTHQKDFVQAAPALARVLQRHPDVTLTVIGFLEIPECLQSVSGQIRKIPFVPYQDLLAVCAGFYVVVVPLEYNTAFCQAKSELKYFEQALLGIPVIVHAFRGIRCAVALLILQVGVRMIVSHRKNRPLDRFAPAFTALFFLLALGANLAGVSISTVYLILAGGAAGFCLYYLLPRRKRRADP